MMKKLLIATYIFTIFNCLNSASQEKAVQNNLPKTFISGGKEYPKLSQRVASCGTVIAEYGDGDAQELGRARYCIHAYPDGRIVYHYPSEVGRAPYSKHVYPNGRIDYH